MAIKPTVSKEDFVKNSGAPRTLTVPRGPRVKKLSEEQATTFKALLFGPTGSGKTYAIKGLLEHGFKVLVISTDMGGDGLVTVKMALRNEGKANLLENCASIVLSNYTEVMTFLNTPEAVYPEIFTDALDFLVWDGFSSFQQTILSDEIGQMTPVLTGDKTVSDARDSGLQLELQDWGMVKAGTIRALDKFLKLNNRKTGQVFHKLVTCLEGIKAVRTGKGIDTVTTYTDAHEPMLQGAAAKLVGPAFDIIINTRIEVVDSVRTFRYLTGTKTRGLILETSEPGDFYSLWHKISGQLGIRGGEIDKDLLENTSAALTPEMASVV